MMRRCQPLATLHPMNAPSTSQKTFLGTPRIPARYAGIVMPFLLSLLMTLVVSLIVSACGYSVWLWTKGQIGPGAVAAVTAMTLRVSGMSHWIMWEMASLFENIGTIQDGIATLTRPRQVLDAPDAKPLEVSRGEVAAIE